MAYAVATWDSALVLGAGTCSACSVATISTWLGWLSYGLMRPWARYVRRRIVGAWLAETWVMAMRAAFRPCNSVQMRTETQRTTRHHHLRLEQTITQHAHTSTTDAIDVECAHTHTHEHTHKRTQAHTNTRTNTRTHTNTNTHLGLSVCLHVGEETQHKGAALLRPATERAGRLELLRLSVAADCCTFHEHTCRHPLQLPQYSPPW
jgi:ABC-type nickel/cobalt efflux system permease component RcnA